ncbi:hypothetical protein M501DRAFT_995921 [Patellaria atrata CBS 101060]|uniref:Uncharacterized protein n=1 Tax=Patellaria atrata CBS 101060 TaxID=1346257 RepID=A0A9P4VLB4_9PEZI|nr:hypothetical protein M501DRAFT_995921 [Patellaria atrata CBS 101060]
MKSPKLRKRSYRIFRPSNTRDPCTELRFSPPADSDDLYDALRKEYPEGKSHDVRKRLAILTHIRNESMEDLAKGLVSDKDAISRNINVEAEKERSSTSISTTIDNVFHPNTGSQNLE